jgi:hypothetical protein
MSTTSGEGKEYLSNPRGGFGGPVLASHKSATMAFFDGYKYNCANFSGQYDLLYQRTTNNGRNWSNSGDATAGLVLIDAGCIGGANCTGPAMMCLLDGATPVVDEVAGVVIVLFGYSNAGDLHSEMFLMRTMDLGLTFSAPKSHIGPSVHAPAWCGVAATSVGIQQASGGLLVPGYHSIPPNKIPYTTPAPESTWVQHRGYNNAGTTTPTSRTQRRPESTWKFQHTYASSDHGVCSHRR